MAMKKGLIALAGAATMLVGATAASAGVGDDVKGTKYETPINKLAALGIATGYEDGSIQPEKTITRAEFAAIVVRELNLGDNFTAADTKFTDVSADNHWAGGYINVAVGQGILKGYPDGTFKPDAPVTYAEAATMLVRMLGYSPAVDENNWPNSYISRAASIGITNGVRVSANDAALRGDVMMMAANSLDADIMKQVGWGTEVRYEIMDGSNGNAEESILTEYWDIDVYDDKDEYLVVNGVPRTNISGLEANEITFSKQNGDPHGGDYEVVSYFNPNDFLGQEVEVWIDEDDDIVYYIAASDDQEVVFDTFDKWQDSETNIKLDNGDDYDVLEDAQVYYNLENVQDFDEWGKDIQGEALVKLVLNSKDDVTAMVITDLGASDAKFGIVESIDVENETISFLDGSSTGGNSLDMEDEDYIVVRNGDTASLEDLEEGDVINWFENDDDYFVLATSTKIEGTVEDVKYTDNEVKAYDLVIDGVKYDVAKDATFSQNNNEDIDDVTTDDLDVMDGVNATLYLDAAGDVRHIETEELAGAAKNVAVVTKNVKWLVQDEEWELTLVNEQGQEVEYRFEYDDIDINGEEPDNDDAVRDALTVSDYKNNLLAVEYDLDRNGNLKSLDILEEGAADDDYEISFSRDIEFDKYDDNIDFGNLGTFKANNNTVIFDVTGAIDDGEGDDDGFADGEIDDVDVLTWDDVKDMDNDVKNAAIKIKSNGRDVEYLFILESESSLSSKANFGYVTGFKTVDRDDAVKIVTLDGEEKTIVYDDSDVYAAPGVNSGLVKGAFIRYELDADGDIDEAQILATAGTKGGYYTTISSKTAWNLDRVVAGVVEKSTSSSIVLEDNGNVVVNSNTVYVDLIDDGEMDIVNGVNDGDLVLAVDTDDDGNAADFVVIISEDYEGDITSSVEVALDALNDADTVPEMKAAIEDADLGLDLDEYNTLETASKTAVAEAVLDAMPEDGYANVDDVQDALDDAVADQLVVEALAAVNDAVDAFDMKAAIENADLGLTLDEYSALSATNKIIVAQAVLDAMPEDGYADVDDVQDALDAAIGSLEA